MKMINPDRIKKKSLKERIKKVLPKTKKQKAKEDLEKVVGELHNGYEKH